MDYEELRKGIRKMKRGDTLYFVLKEELKAKKHWKDLPRGNAKKGYRESVKTMEKYNLF
jgi:hypothetical protein